MDLLLVVGRGLLDVVVDSGRGPTYGVWVDLLLVVGGGPLDVVRDPHVGSFNWV